MKSRMWPGAAGLVGAFAMSCVQPRLAPPDLDAVATRYIQLARELAQHEPSLIDHWLVDPPADVGPRRPVAVLELAVSRLARELEGAVAETEGLDRTRAIHLQGQVRALHLAARRLLGESFPFDTEARLGLGIDRAGADRFKADRAREGLERELPGTTPLVERVAAFRARFVVPRAAREAVVLEALEACRAATRDALPLPADESVDLAFVNGLPWDAHARYLGAHRTRVDVNASRPLDLSRALRLACHEGYAGHHAQHIWVADTLVGERRWHEFTMVPGFGPQLLLAEGAAEAGTDLALPADRRLTVYRERLAPAAGLPIHDLERLVRVEEHLADVEPLIGDIAQDYLDNRINTATAIERLSAEALVFDAEAFVPFLEQRRTRVLAYPEGRRLVRERLGDRGLPGLRDLVLAGEPLR